MSLKYRLKITVINRLGTFTGYTANEADSLENVTKAHNEILRGFNRITQWIIYTEDGEDMCFNWNILKESVIQLKIVSVLTKE